MEKNSLSQICFFIVLISLISCDKDEAVPAGFNVLLTQTTFEQREMLWYDFVIGQEESIIVAYNSIDAADLEEDGIIDETFVTLQKISREGEEVWLKTYPTDQPAKVFDVLAAQDGGYLLLGNIMVNNSTSQSMLLIKTDGEGTFNWQQEFATGQDGDAYEMVQKANGNIVVVGDADNSELIELDKEGNLISRTTIPANLAGVFPFHLGLDIGADGTTVVAGNGMIAYNNDGGSEWDFSYPSNNLMNRTLLLSVSPLTEVQGGGYLGFGFKLTREEEFAPEEIDYFLTRVDEAGSTLWEKSFDNDVEDIGSDIHPTSDGNFVAVGVTSLYLSQESYLRSYKFDPDGNILWQHKLDPSSSADFILPCSIREIDENHVVVMYAEVTNGNVQDIAELRLTKIRID